MDLPAIISALPECGARDAAALMPSPLATQDGRWPSPLATQDGRWPSPLATQDGGRRWV